MKKILSIALAVVMVLAVASVASAFNWSKPASSTTADNFGYSIDVMKFTRSTGALGSSSFTADDAATAVNGADVYFTIKLTVNNPDEAIEKVAQIKVNFTALQGMTNFTSGTLVGLENGVYYFGKANGSYDFRTIDAYNGRTPVIATNCLDTDTAKVEAKVTANRPFNTVFNAGSYDIYITENGPIHFYEASNPASAAGENRIATFYRNSDGLVTSVEAGPKGTPQAITELYQWLNNGDADSIYTAIQNKEMYMTDDNLRVAFGFTYSQSDSATWAANSTPIILDPIVSIPKTGDNASVIGFAMIMVAVVAAAVAVKKVRA